MANSDRQGNCNQGRRGCLKPDSPGSKGEHPKADDPSSRACLEADRQHRGRPRKLASRQTDSDGDDAVVSLSASARGHDLTMEKRHLSRLTATGNGRITSHREGLPEGGAEPGVTYPDVYKDVDIQGEPEETKLPDRR